MFFFYIARKGTQLMILTVYGISLFLPFVPLYSFVSES